MDGQNFITALGKELEQDLKLDASNAVVATIDEVTLRIELRPEEQIFHLMMGIGEPNPKGGSDIFAKLLAANFLAMETAGAYLSYNSEINHVFLECNIPTHNATPDDFVNATWFFVNIVADWMTKLNEINDEFEDSVQGEDIQQMPEQLIRV